MNGIKGGGCRSVGSYRADFKAVMSFCKSVEAPVSDAIPQFYTAVSTARGKKLSVLRPFYRSNTVGVLVRGHASDVTLQGVDVIEAYYFVLGAHN